MRRFSAALLAVCLTCLGILLALPSEAEQTPPVTLSAKLDPALELSGDGTISFITFTLTNTSDNPYLLHNASLSCEELELLEELDAMIEVPAHGTKELKLQNVPIQDSLLDVALTFRLDWQSVSFASEDLYETVPIYAAHFANVEITVPRFVEPLILVSVSTDLDTAKVGSTVTATYTLKNETKFDMTSLSLYDVGTLNLLIPLEKSSVLAGETMTVTHTFEMGETTTQLQPKVLYNVRGKLVETIAESPAVVQCAIVQLDFSVQAYPATEDGTLFSISVTNSGTHTMTDISVRDEIQTAVNDPFSLAPGQTKTLSYLVTSAVSASQIRIVSFSLTATDVFLDTYTFVDPNMYEVIPYITTDQINISLSATLTGTYTNENGVLYGTVAFELRNYSSVTLRNAQLKETLVYTASPLIMYDELTYGITSYSQDFAVSDLSALSFVFSVVDAAGNEYSSQRITLDLSNLSDGQAVQAGDKLVDPDIIGSGIDMNKYLKLGLKTLLVLAVCVGLCCVIIYALYSAEKREKRNLPLEDSGLSDESFGITQPRSADKVAFRSDEMEPLPASEQATPLGYVAPTKLRYIQKPGTSANAYSDIRTDSIAHEGDSDIKVYKSTRSNAVAQTVAIRRKTHAEEELGRTRRIEPQPSDAQRHPDAENRPVKHVAPAANEERAFPCALPSDSQLNRKEARKVTAVFRVQA